MCLCCVIVESAAAAAAAAAAPITSAAAPATATSVGFGQRYFYSDPIHNFLILFIILYVFYVINISYFVLIY